jgi:uncharacterized protein (DUF2336 family)
MSKSAKPAKVNSESASLIDELQRSLDSRNASHRVKVLKQVTDLFVSGSRRYNDRQVALFDDILVQLIAEIEEDARVMLSRRMSKLDNAPRKTIRSLAFDDAIAVAQPVLVNSPQLSDADLVEIAESKGQKYLYAISQRLNLSEAVTDVLIERGDRRVVRSTARNLGARISPNGYEKLTVRARSDRALAFAIARRNDFPRLCFIKLVENASASVREKLEAELPEAVAAIRQSIDEVACTLRQQAREASPDYTHTFREAKLRFGVSAATEAHVHGPARSQQFDRTVIALAKFGHFPIDLVERALIDDGADMIVILARAANCSWLTTRQLLLMHAARREMPPDELARAHDRFERLSPATARQVVDFHERRRKLKAVPSAAPQLSVS